MTKNKSSSKTYPVAIALLARCVTIGLVLGCHALTHGQPLTSIGIATALCPGITAIMATSAGISGSTTLIVSPGGWDRDSNLVRFGPACTPSGEPPCDGSPVKTSR